MRRSGLPILMLAVATAGTAMAAPLAPSKPSDVVALMPNAGDGANTPCGLDEQRVDGVISPADGSLTPFTIPAKEVLVLTGGTWTGSAGANANASLELTLETGSTKNRIVSSPAVRTDSAGFAAGSFTLEPGIVIRPGASLCATLDVDGVGTSVFPRLTGFLAKDK